MSKKAETFEFQTETRELLDLMIHSIYSNKDIFLRELISNASDAIDKRRFEALKNPDLLDKDAELHIFIEPNQDAHTLAISDNGIGMTRQEVIELIGTIAKSGSGEFLKIFKESKGKELPPELIGQFGVGFYSSFMVADKITLLTRHAAEETATLWESSGDGTYNIEETTKDDAGTTITLHLKDVDSEDGLHDYTAEWTIKGTVKKYSDFVAYPIKMNVERREVERDEEGKPVEGAEEKTVIETETLNSMKAIWLRDKDEVTDEEYNEFYKHISHDWTEPLRRISAKIEGTLMYRLMLFIPSKAPLDLFYRDGHKGVHLYVKRVFIMDDCKELIPEYLRFISGVVDSEDLSLNISREILQQDRQIQRMQKGIVNKILDTFKSMRDNENEEYLKFWKEFGRVLKEGIYQDQDNKDALLDLVFFESTESENELTSLSAYVDRMKPEQEAIYYMTGESRSAIENSPHLEAFKEKGYEVLILSEPVDEVWVQSVFEYKEKKLQSIGKGAVELGTEEEKEEAKKDLEKKQKKFTSLLDCLKDKLDEHVKEVRLSNRLTSSAACLVSEQSDMTPQMEAMMKQFNADMPATKRILELNPNHTILTKLQEIFDKDNNDAALGDYAELLYGQAVLAEGGQLPNPGKFSKLVAELMVNAI